MKRVLKMETAEKNSKRVRRSTRFAIWVILIPTLVIATVMLLVKLEAGKAEQREAAERLRVATEQKLDFISEGQDVEYVQEEMEVKDSSREKPDNLIASVKNSTLPGYEHTTIGRAFDAYFESPKWEFKVAENGSRFIEFSGKLKDQLLLTWDKGDTVIIRFAISHDSTSFELWSIEFPPNSIGIEAILRSSDWENREAIDTILGEIYAIR